MSLNAPAAQGRRGATVRVDLKDGARVQGELVAVGEASLLIRDQAGLETSFGIDETVGVTVTRHKKKFPGGLVGFAVGASVGYAVGANPHGWPHSEDALVLRGIGTGILWGVLGAVVGSIATAGRGGTHETTFLIEGLSDEQVQETVKRLREYARIR